MNDPSYRSLELQRGEGVSTAQLSECLAVHASYAAYHLKRLKLLMCYMITRTAFQSER